MKLSEWMTRENRSDRDVSDALQALDDGFHCSEHTVTKWRRGERTPRGRALALLGSLTNGDVTANDFVEQPVREVA